MWAPRRSSVTAARSNNPVAFGGFGGFKFFVGEGGALSTEAFVTSTNYDEFDFTTYGVRVGVSIFF